MLFAAVELKQGDTAHSVIRTVLETASAQGQQFSVLEFLGVLTLGRIRFIRFRTNGKDLKSVLESLDRGVIYQAGGGYLLTFPGQTPGAVSIVSMQAVADLGLKRTYRGPGVKFWERQFL